MVSNTPGYPIDKHAYIAVLGPSTASAKELDIAEKIGRLLAQKGIVLLCGGLGGVMEAASKGAAEEGGQVVGFLPEANRANGNPYLSIAIATGLGELRNGLIIRAADAVISVGGSWGTTSEIAFAMRTNTPVISIKPWRTGRLMAPRATKPTIVRSPLKAVEIALTRARARQRFAGDLRDSTPSPQPRPEVDHIWQAYELAQKHYDLDLQLFSSRMNLFLFVQSALIAIVASLGSRTAPVIDRAVFSIFGLILATSWFIVAASSYVWIKTWRAHMVDLGESLERETDISPTSSLFLRPTRRAAHKKRGLAGLGETLSWYIRPTLISCFLPLLFMAAWIYIGWIA